VLDLLKHRVDRHFKQGLVEGNCFGTASPRLVPDHITLYGTKIKI